MVIGYAAIAAVLALAACGGADDATKDEQAAGDANIEEGAAPERADAGDMDAPGGDGAASEDAGGVIDQVQEQALGRDIIYTVELRVVTEDLDEATERATSITQGAGGFVANERATEERATLTLRIPSDEHADAVSELEDLGDVADRSRTAEDVTHEVVDVESRIESQRASIARIQELLQEAEDVSDIVSIESELARREADLDALLSRQEHLEDQTSLATVTVTFELDEEGDTEEAGTPGFLSGLGAGWDAFVGVLVVATAVLGAILPFLIIAGPLAVALWYWFRRRRVRSEPQPEPSPST
ncbi:DUF4349 domain-containing protein [Phytoactinopolyspora halophila]|nr:DUF4349 domain-containing protein [Phytoactinopolyspora halophila]